MAKHIMEQPTNRASRLRSLRVPEISSMLSSSHNDFLMATAWTIQALQEMSGIPPSRIGISSSTRQNQEIWVNDHPVTEEDMRVVSASTPVPEGSFDMNALAELFQVAPS